MTKTKMMKMWMMMTLKRRMSETEKKKSYIFPQLYILRNVMNPKTILTKIDTIMIPCVNAPKHTLTQPIASHIPNPIRIT